MLDLRAIRTLLIDCDGVLWRGDEPLPGLERFFAVLDRRGIQWVLISNNPNRMPAEYIAKLARFGVRARPEQVFTSPLALAYTLCDLYPPGTAFYVLAEEALKAPLREAGFVLFEGEERPDQPITAVVTGNNRAATYPMLAVATQLIHEGAAYYATNIDRTYMTSEGIMPGSGWLREVLFTATGVEPIVTGKPHPGIFRAALRRFNAAPETTAMLGDRMDTDIKGARAVGIGAILVLSGVTHREDLPRYDYQPALIYEHIGALADDLEKAGGGSDG
ncbi:MAG: HAD-IIA family hydrolase [Anaerolineae bacterium]